MKRIRVWLGLGLGLVLLALAACGSGPIREAYTAAGDATRPDDLTPTATFRPDDDLNVVVRLNSHSRRLPVQAVFRGPEGSQYATDTLEASATVNVVLLGLDWEAHGIAGWPTGTWQVDVLVDGETQTTLEFRVQPGTEG